MVGRDARGEPAQALGFIQVAASQRELRLHDIGAEQVGVQAEAARQCGLRGIELAAAEQQAGALEMRVGIVG